MLSQAHLDHEALRSKASVNELVGASGARAFAGGLVEGQRGKHVAELDAGIDLGLQGGLVVAAQLDHAGLEAATSGLM